MIVIFSFSLKFYYTLFADNLCELYVFMQVMVNDTDGLYDMAHIFIYLLREDQRVRFVLRQHPPEIREKIDVFRE